MSTITNSKSLTDKMIHNSDKFIKSKWSLIIFTTLIIIAGIVNYLLFTFGVIDIKTPWLPGEDYEIKNTSRFAYLAWISMTLSIVGSIFNIWTFIYITRFDKNFIWFAFLASITAIPNQFFLGAIFTAICFIAIIIFEVKIYFDWRKAEQEGTHEIVKPVLKKHFIILGVVWIIFIIFGLSVSLTSDALTHGQTNFWIPVMDVLASSIILVCWSLALMKNRWGLFGLIINDNVYIVMYYFLGAYAMSATFLILLFMNLMGFLGWSKKKEE